jgi:hypothetical protein
MYFAFFLLHSLAQDFWQEPRVIVLFWLVLGWQRYCARQQEDAAPAGPVADELLNKRPQPQLQ